MKISSLLGKLDNHGLIKELVDAHILTHTMSNEARDQMFILKKYKKIQSKIAENMKSFIPF